MRQTAFWDRMRHRFGPAYAESLARDLVLSNLDGRTAAEALAAGVPPRDVWVAVCDATGVPERDRQ